MGGIGADQTIDKGSEGNNESERFSNEKITEIPITLKEQMLHSTHNNTQDKIDAIIICYKN